MSILVRYEIQDRVAVVTIDNPPVNALSPGVPEGINSAVLRAGADPEVLAIVILGGGRTFIAGADISVLQEMAWSGNAGVPTLHGLLAVIEDSLKPVVMAIHGTALGGGLEVAMAGHYRIATSSAQMGQPEVNLGLIPGFEGTQRLPRLVGIEKAIDMCVTGKPISAEEALAAGLIDLVVEGDLRTMAISYASQSSMREKTRERKDKLGTPESNARCFEAGRQLAGKTRRHQQAPLRVTEALEAATTLPFSDGCKRERELFEASISSTQAKAMMHAFFAERAAAKVAGLNKTTAICQVARVAVIGAGTMGGGIAMAFANAGVPVLLKESTADALETGLGKIRRNYEISVKRGRFTTADVDGKLGLIRPQVDFAGFDSVDLVIEAVYENMAVKQSVFKEIDAIVKPACLLASNTSTLSIDEIASVTARPERMIGLHFFSPAHVMRLLEIVRGEATSAETIASMLALAKQLKKVGVVVGNGPGFVGNRMMLPYMYETQFLVEDGATPEAVDRVLTDFGMAMGMFAVDDLAGLDVGRRVRQELEHFTARGSRRPLVQDQLYAMGRYGQKTGSGWYRYDAERKATVDPEVNALIEQMAEEAGIPRRSIGDQEILERSLYALINEGARVLEEGRVERASDIDVIYMNGYGFPAWRGGPMFYADTVGLTHILRSIQHFRKEFGNHWIPAPLLERLAGEGRSFREYDREERQG